MLSKNISPNWFKGRSIEFDKALKATNKQTSIIVEYFTEKIPSNRNTPQQKKELRVLIGNLIHADELGANLEYYIGNQKKARRTIKDKLVQLQLVEYYNGSSFEGGDSYSSKMMPLPLLNDLFNPLIRVTVTDPKTGKEQQIRGEDQTTMDHIFAYNEFMKEHKVTARGGNQLATNIHRCHKIYPDDQKVYKYRFHQSSYQSISSNERSDIKIDGEAVCRFDIKGSHPQILHNLSGFAMTHDPYEAFPEHPEMRVICKCAMMMIINTGSRKSAVGAFKKEINDNPERFLNAINCMRNSKIKTKDIFDKVEGLNPKISQYFYQSSCREAMSIESKILFVTMVRLSRCDKPIPSIQVFDELIVPLSKESKAKAMLEYVWEYYLKFKPTVTVERPK